MATPLSCSAAPQVGCRVSVAPGRAFLALRDKTPDDKDRLLWKWVRGAATTIGDFGNPQLTTNYQFCIYDGTSSLVMSASAPADGVCNSARPGPCWRVTSSGFRYNDKDLTPDGLKQIRLQAGTAGRARIRVRGNGVLLDMPTLPLTLPVRAQIVSSDGVCWEATYSTFIRNQPDQFRAKGN